MLKKRIGIYIVALLMLLLTACRKETDLKEDDSPTTQIAQSTTELNTGIASQEESVISQKGNMAIYNQGQRADLKLGMTLQEAKSALKTIGYDETNENYHTWRNHDSQYISYKDFSFQTMPLIENGVTQDYVAWIYIKSPDYQTGKGLKVGAGPLEVRKVYGEAEYTLGTYEERLPVCWMEEPFSASSTEVLEWQRNDYYFFIVIADRQMGGYGIALNSLQAQEDLFEKNKNVDTFVYENKLAGFSVVLPDSWENYFRSEDTEQGTNFYYYKDDQFGAPYMFTISSIKDDQTDSPIRAGIAHNKTFTSTTSTDVSLGGLYNWDWDKSNQMMKDRSSICESFQEIPIDTNAAGHSFEHKANDEMEIEETLSDTSQNSTDDFSYKIDTYSTGFGEFQSDTDMDFDRIDIKEESEYYSIDFQYPQYISVDSPYSLDLCNEEIRNLAEQVVKEGKESFPTTEEDIEMYRDEIETGGMPNFGIDGFFESYTLDRRYISVRFGGGYEVGANHPLGFLETICWDLKTNQPVMITDIFQNPTTGLEKLADLCKKALLFEATKLDYIVYVDENSNEFQTGIEAKADNFSLFALGKKEIYLYFPPYVLTDYASSGGCVGFRVALPYDLLKDELLIEY